MSLIRRKSCSALASTILESPLHRTKATCTIFFRAICQAALPGRPLDTPIYIGKNNKIIEEKRHVTPLYIMGSMSFLIFF